MTSFKKRRHSLTSPNIIYIGQFFMMSLLPWQHLILIDLILKIDDDDVILDSLLNFNYVNFLGLRHYIYSKVRSSISVLLILVHINWRLKYILHLFKIFLDNFKIVEGNKKEILFEYLNVFVLINEIIWHDQSCWSHSCMMRKVQQELL